MIDWKTIKIPAEDYERHNTKRQNLNETWAQYIDGQAPDGVDAEELAREVARQLDYAMLATKTADELEGRMQ